MISSELVRPDHLKRRAVIYIRQSTRHQVRSNLESQRLQRDMQEVAMQLGWAPERIDVVDADTGLTAASTAGREEYKHILSEVALGHVGIVISYESARVSRNCSDWYPLLDLCTARQCLIADRDGVYDPATPNGRLLLGMKGIVSELELHTLRGRLVAGIQNKARRGELALALPAGLLRLEDGRVVRDPDRQVQHAIELIFKSFLELRSASKVVRHFRVHDLAVPRRHRNQQTVWRPPTVAGILSMLKNPAYAGAFVYGRTRTVRNIELDGVSVQQKKRDRQQWSVVVKDRYPPYISWETFERIQAIVQDNYLQYDRNRSRGVPRDGAALLHGITFCGACGHKMVVQYKGGTHYICNYLRAQHQTPVCQYLLADPIDAYVVEAFFKALAPAELDLYEAALQQRRDSQRSVHTAQQRELQRLRYEADLARRQFDRVDPDNRLVASELERRWEMALAALRQAEERFETMKSEQDKVVPISIQKDLRSSFESLGETLPDLWKQTGALTRAQRKALLRCLIDKVVIHRATQRDRVHTRIVWRGGAITQTELPVTVHRLRDMTGFDQLVEQILQLETDGLSDEAIADRLTAEGFHSPHHTDLLPSTVKGIRLSRHRFHRYKRARPRQIAGRLTLPQLASAIGVSPYWLYHLIDTGRIQIKKDAATRLYLFPDDPDTIETFRRLKSGELRQVSVGGGHQDG